MSTTYLLIYLGSELLRAAAMGDVTALQYQMIAEEGGTSVDLEEAAENGVTALMLAARGGHVSELILLLSKGASVNSQSRHGVTPLLMAAEEGQLSVVQQLIEKHADVDRSTSTNTTPLMQACRFGTTYVLTYYLLTCLLTYLLGGAPGLISYNILVDAFASRGQLLNCESLHSQV